MNEKRTMVSVNGKIPSPQFDGQQTENVLVLTGTGLRIAIVHARWNTAIIDALVSGAYNSLVSAGVSKDNIVIQSVPGSYELPLAVQK